MDTPEPEYRKSLRNTAARLAGVAARLEATLVLHDEQGKDYTVPLGSSWQPLPGRKGVQIFHIPNPSGEPGLFMTAFCAEPGSEYTGSRIDESRLLVLLEGLMDFNGKPLSPGNVVWIEPGQPTTWHTEPGALGVVRYDSPNPL